METILSDAPKVISLFGLAFFYFWPAMPAGLAMGLSPLLVVLTATLSYVSGAALMLIFGERVRNWIVRRLRRVRTPDPDSPGRLRQLWDRFGVVGLGLLAPMTVGSQTGAMLGLALKARPRVVLAWMAVGALGWAVLIMLAALLGLAGLEAAG